MKIREATSRDLPGIVEIERLSFDNPWSLDAFERELSLPFSRMIVATKTATENASLIGFLCRWIVADECHILNVAVHPQMRQQGIGKRLMQHALAEARAKNVQVITLEVRRSNTAALSLYRGLGFRAIGIRPNYYVDEGEDAVVMTLDL